MRGFIKTSKINKKLVIVVHLSEFGCPTRSSSLPDINWMSDSKRIGTKSFIRTISGLLGTRFTEKKV